MSFLTATKMVLTLVCDESAHLLSDSLDRRLTRVERLALGLHLLICRNCRRFRRQIAFIREAFHYAARDATADESLTLAPSSSNSLSPEARRRIADALSRG